MKTSKLFHIIGVLILFILASCSSMSYVKMEVLVPAEISVPQHIKKVVIANRSLPEKDEKWRNFLEGFISGESIMADRDASNLCVSGLNNSLNANPRFQAVLKNDTELKGTGTKQFPVLLDWSRAKAICDQYGADALILLETFDSDMMLSQGKRDVKKKVNDQEVIVPEFLADLKIRVNAGWRIYDVKNNKIIDESTFGDEKAWNAVAENPDKALSKLPSKRGALNESGEFAGRMFGKRISPTWVWVSRNYYIRKHDGFKSAKQYVKSNNWEKAAEIWKGLTVNSDPKIAGRACFNMALAAEMDGNLQLALTWAEKSMKEYKISAARSYVNIINTRIMEQERLKEQMEGSDKK
ncbi:MAG: DUF6340 family protein [Bacteroidota bacterium]